MAGTGQSGLFYLQNAGGIALQSFPKDLRRSLLSRIEPRFTIIFGSLFLAAFVAVSLLSSVKVTETVNDKQIAKIQERYAQLVLNQPKAKPPEEKKEEKSKVGAESGRTAAKEAPKEAKVDREKESFAARHARQEATREERQAVRQRVAAAVQTAGIFAAITSSGGGKSGSSSGGGGGVSDLLGAAGDGIGDLGNIKVSKGTFATRGNVDVGELRARRGAVTGGVDIARESVGHTRAERIATGGGVAITSAVPEVTGNTTNAEARSQASIKKVIDVESNRLKRVYETWLKRDPSLAGQLKIKFTIMPDGSVTNVTVVSSSTKNSEFDETLVRYVKRWSFPAMEGGGPVEVVYPFVFEAQA
jgi:TonB family protein